MLRKTLMLLVASFFVFSLGLLNLAKAEPIVKVGVDTTFPPFEMEEHGKVVGFDVDLVNAIAKVEGFKVEWHTMDFQGLIPALQTGTIQMAVAGMTITPQRAQVVYFSKPYYHSGQSILVKKDSPIKDLADLKGKTVATKLGTTADIMLSKMKDIKVERFTNIDDAYNQLQNGGAQAVVFDNPVNINYARTHKNVHTVGKLLTGEDYGIAVSKQDPKLLEKVNAGLEKIIQNGTYLKLYRKYFGDDNAGLITK